VKQIGTTPTDTTTEPFQPRYRASVLRGFEVENIERVKNTVVEVRVGQLAALGYEVDATPEVGTPYSIISYYIPGGGAGAGVETPLATTWGLGPNEFERDLWDHPRITTETDKFTALGFTNGNELLKRIRTAINSFVEGQTTVPSVLLNPDPSALDDGETTPITYEKIGIYLGQLSALGLGLVADSWAAFIQSRLRGTQAFMVSAYSLIRQQTWASEAVATVSLANVGRVFTTAQLIAIEGVPTGLIFPLASGVWLKKTPTVQQQEDGRYVATNEWWWAERYDPFVYEAAS
jgi:hypothetical protein